MYIYILYIYINLNNSDITVNQLCFVKFNM